MSCLLDARLSRRPSPTHGGHTGLRWYREHNEARRLAYSPLTNGYRHISERGPQGGILSFGNTDTILVQGSNM